MIQQFIKCCVWCCLGFLCASPAKTQPKITSVEYYIDSDPGYGKAIAISIAQNTNLSNITADINATALSSGVHMFCIRAKDANGKWSPDNKWLFVKNTTATPVPNIIKAEYYIDSDPGYNKGVSIALTPATNLSNITAGIDPATLNPGVHIFGIRAKDASGGWSPDNKWLFVKNAATLVASNIIKAEYYIDTDPGYNKATAISFAQGTNLSNITAGIDPSALTPGVHIFGIRAKDASGGWSLDNSWLFVKNAVAPTISNISKAEYYIDTDPGYDKGTSISITPGTNISNITANIDATALSPGAHIFAIRAKDGNGKWSLDNKWLFIKPGSTVPAAPNLKQVEYYIDADPGYGRGIPVAINNADNLSNVSLAVNVSGLAPGTHTLFMRSKDAGNHWSSDNMYLFVINTAIASPSIVVNSIVSRKLCQKDSVSISYQATGTYNTGNKFNVELSDVKGGFSSPTIIGSHTGTDNSIIRCLIPPASAAGTGYKIRIKSTNPVVTGLAISDSIKVSKLPSPVITPPGVLVIREGDSVKLSTTLPYSGYLWSNAATTSSIQAKKYGSYSVKVTDANSCSATSAPVAVSVTPVITASGPVSNVCPGTPIMLTSSAANSYKWNTAATTQSITVTAGGSYYVVANGGGKGDTSLPVTVTYKGCGTPQALPATNISTTSANISWSATACSQRYKVQYRLSGTTAWNTLSTATAVASYNLTGLSASKTYQWRVSNVCAEDPLLVSSYSAIDSFTTKNAALAVASPELIAVGGPDIQVTLYPNPTTRVATLKVQGNKTKVAVTISDLTGKVLWHQDEADGTIRLPVDGFSAGTYLVRIKDVNCVKTLRLIKNQ